MTTRKVKICAPDRPGLFSKIAGLFTLNHLNILDAQVFTWDNNIAVDEFEVTPPADRIFESEKWDKAEKQMAEVLCDKLDIALALKKKEAAAPPVRNYLRGKPDKVVIDNTSSSFFTIVEVYTYDFPGILFKITDALYRCGFDIDRKSVV